MIPKIIHYCWLSNDPIPDIFQQYIQDWKTKLIGYEFILWNFDRFDINSSIWVKQAFEAKKYAFAADYIRLYAVYKYGGIYLDCDVEIIKPFDDLLNDRLMLGFESDSALRIEAGCFGAEKGNPYIKKCLEYFYRAFINTKLEVLPVIMQNIKQKHYPNESFNIHSSDFFTAKNFETGLIKTTKNTHSIHHYAGSWFSETDKIYLAKSRKIYSIIKISFIAKIVVCSMYFYKKIKDIGFINTMFYICKYVIQRIQKIWIR